MTALTIKNIPEPLYEALKHTAKVHRRSLNNEVIVLLEKTLMPKHKTAEEWINATRNIRASIPENSVSLDDIERAINEGRA